MKTLKEELNTIIPQLSESWKQYQTENLQKVNDKSNVSKVAEPFTDAQLESINSRVQEAELLYFLHFYLINLKQNPKIKIFVRFITSPKKAT